MSTSCFPYGSWSSPITSHLISEKKNRMTEMGIGGKNREIVYWVERRPTENGRNVICGYNLLTQETRDVTPTEMNSRSTVHEYGGGDFCPLPNSNSVLTINHTSKNIKLLNHSDHASVDVTPSEDELFRYGDISTDPLDRGYLYAVREDHSIDIPSKVVNCVVAIPFPTSAASLENWNFSPVSSQTVLTNEEQDPSIMYSSPSVDPSGKFLCWMEWSHPNMPWNESSLYVGLLSPDGARVVSKLKIAGGPQESVHHPRWVPSTRAADELCLIYISDKDNGWWNIHRTTLTLPSNLSSSSSSTLSDLSSVLLAHSPVLIANDYEFGKPQWNLGNKYFDFLVTKTENGDDSCRLVCMCHDQTHTMHAILCSPYQTHTVSTTHTAASDSATTTTDLTVLPVPLVPASSPQSQPTKLTICNSLQVAGNSTLVILSGSAVVPLGVYRWDLSSPDSICLIQSSVPLDSVASIPSSYLSIPQHISFPTYSEDSGEGEAMSYGWFYPPTHPTHAPDGIPSSSFSTLPPLLVKCHGGPTGSTSTEYRLDIQYFTSRGIAVLDVDYSGSSGYGRQYRERLNQKWGIYDRKDCVFGVKYLVTRGLVDEQRVAIDGSSAGGYTTLAAIALEEEKVFTAATSAYGIGDLTLLLSDTHKFESHYLTQLIGPADPGINSHLELYQSRSPINFVDQIRCNLLLLQGTEDRVVPPNQAQSMFDSVRAKGIPTALVLFPGEGHGWRKAENIKRALRLELSFYGAVFGFSPETEEAEDVPLENREALR